MYRGNNPTALTSQKLLLDALNALLEEKEFKDISVSELCIKSGVSRQTFYSLFGTKENILLHQLELAGQGQEPIPEDTTEVGLLEICERFSTFIISNEALIKMLVANELMNVFYKLNYDAMSTCRYSFLDLDEEEREYAAMFMSAGLCTLTQKYFKEHDKLDKDQLTRLSYKIMSGEIYRSTK